MTLSVKEISSTRYFSLQSQDSTNESLSIVSANQMILITLVWYLFKSEFAEGSWCNTEAAWACSITWANKEKLGARNSGENNAKIRYKLATRDFSICNLLKAWCFEIFLLKFATFFDVEFLKENFLFSVKLMLLVIRQHPVAAIDEQMFPSHFEPRNETLIIREASLW